MKIKSLIVALSLSIVAFNAYADCTSSNARETAKNIVTNDLRDSLVIVLTRNGTIRYKDVDRAANQGVVHYQNVRKEVDEIVNDTNITTLAVGTHNQMCTAKVRIHGADETLDYDVSYFLMENQIVHPRVQEARY